MNPSASFSSFPVVATAAFRLPLARALALAALLGPAAAWGANTEKDVLPNATALDNPASYQGGTLPGSTSDVTFTAVGYANPAFTLNAASLTVGTLNLDTTQALAISASRTLTLNGGGDSVAGSAAADLLYLAAGASLTYNGTGGIQLRAAGNLNVAAGAQATLNTAIDSSSALTKTGAGTLTLAGNNTNYKGNTTFAAGTLQAGSAGALGNSGTLLFTGGTLQYSAANQTDYSKRFSTAAGQAFSLDTNGQNVTLATGLSSSGGTLTKLGAGTLTLNGTGAYTGATAVNAGTLVLNDGANATVTVNYTASLQVQANTTVTGLTGNNSPGGTGVTFISGGTLTNAGTIAGGGGSNNGSGSGGGTAVNANGPGTLANGGAISGGAGGSNGTIGSNGGAAVVWSGGGTLTSGGAISGGAGGTGSVFNGSGGTGVALSDGGTLTNNATLTGGNGGNGSGSGSGGTGGTGVNLGVGDTLVNHATITGGNGGSGGLANGGRGGAGVALGGGALTNDGSIAGGSGGSSPNGNGANGAGVSASGAAATLVNLRGGSISGGVALDNFANRVTLQAGSTVTGGLNLGTSTAATLTLTDDGTGGSQTYSGAVGGATTFSGALAKAGAGTWIIDRTFTPTGGTTLAAGVLQVGSAGALGPGGTIAFTGGTLQSSTANRSDYSARFSTAAGQAFSLDTNGQNITLATGLSSSGGTLTKLGAGTLTLRGDSTYTGNTTASAGTLVLDGGSTATRLLRANAGAEIDYTGGVTVGGNLSNGGGTQRVQSGGATFTSPTAGVLTIFNGVNLAVGGPTTFNQVNNSGAVTVAAGQTLTWTDGQNNNGTLTVNGQANVSGWTSTGVVAINGGATLANANSNFVLGGGSRTTVNAGGTLSTASGTSIELNGALLVNNGTQSGTLNVNYGGTAKGGGTFGTVNVGDGGRFSPGNSPGTATLNGVTFGMGSRYDFELNSAAAADKTPGGGGHADLLAISGTLTLSAGSSANSRFTVGLLSLDQSNNPAMLTDFDASRAYTFTLATAAGGILGFDPAEVSVDASGFLNATNGGSFAVALSADGDSLLVQFNPVPEPTTWAMVAGGLGSLILLQGRRRRTTTTGKPPKGNPSAATVG